MGWLPLELDTATSHTPLAAQIRVQQALELVKQLPLTLGGNLSLSALTAVALWDAAPPVFMLGWLALIWLMSCPGLMQWIKYRNAPAPVHVSVKHIWRAAVFSLVVAAPWAISNWVLFNAAAHDDELFLLYVTGGLTAGAIAALAAIPLVCLTYVTVITSPLILHLLVQGDLEHAVMAIMLVIYVGFLSVFVRNSYRGLVAGAEATIEKQNILDRLKTAHDRLSQAMERTSDEILLFDANERMVLSNAAQSGSMLFEPEQMRTGASLAGMMASSARCGAILDAVGREQAWVTEFLAWYRKPDRDFVFESRNNRVCAMTVQPAADGDRYLLLGDITELRAQTQNAKQSAQRLRDFAESAADWIWELDTNQIFTLLAPHHSSPIPVAHLLGQPLQNLVPLLQDKATLEILQAGFASRRMLRGFRFGLCDGDRTWTLSISGKPITGENNQFQGYRGTFRDDTEEVLAAERLQEAKNRAEDASKTKSEFLAHMSHELRTPLNAIIGFSETMSLEVFGKIEQPKYREYVDNIHASGVHLLGIISDILDISRIESGKADLHEETVDIHALVQGCVRLMEAAAVEAGHIIVVEIPPSLPKLWADARMLKQILINLLGNAVKFTPSTGRITLRAGLTAQGGVQLSVTDNGYGISPADIARVLIPFDRGEAHTRGNAQGSGLGLPLSKMLTELHGGALHLASELGKSTTVSVEFPPLRTRHDTLPANAGNAACR